MDTRIYHKECESLAEAGFDVTLIATDHPDLSTGKTMRFQVSRLTAAGNRWIRMTKNCWEVYCRAKQMKAQIYHFHDPELIWVGWLLKSKDNHVIYDIHEDYETGIRQKKYLPPFLRRSFSWVYRAIENLCIGRFELILAEKYYIDKYQRGETVLNYPVIGPAIEADYTSGIHQTIDLIYTGNVTMDRGALLHARVAGLDSTIRVAYIGKCPRAIADQIYVEAGTAKNQVLIDGIDAFVSRDTIDERYRQGNWLAGLALFPPTEHYMKKELTKFFEYMNAGLPIICSNFPAWSDFVNEHKCGIAVDPNDRESILGAIMYLKNNSDKAREMGRNGQRAVQQELNWEQESAKLVSLYKQLTDSNSCSGG